MAVDEWFEQQDRDYAARDWAQLVKHRDKADLNQSASLLEVNIPRESVNLVLLVELSSDQNR